MSQEITVVQASRIVNRWIIWRWRLSVSPSKWACEGWCQGVRGGEIAEICGGRFVSPCPRLVPLVELDVLLIQTHEERAADIAAREPKGGDDYEFARFTSPRPPLAVEWDEARGAPIRSPAGG